MDQKKKKRMTKNTVPQGFSVPMALVDLISVVFFGLSAVRAGSLFRSVLFVAGAVICLISGVVKVLWKLIAAVSQKNVWPMFVQMRVLMPLGLLTMLLALAVDRTRLDGAAMLAGLTRFPACIFFGARCARNGDDAGFRVPKGLRRPKGELAGADHQQRRADMLFYRAAAGVSGR